MTGWLTVERGDAPLIVTLPHSGDHIDPAIAGDFLSPWLARKDADWWIDRLYRLAAPAGATLIRTAVSRSVIDVNRDPSGASLYPGQATTELCPTTSFDGEPLYRPGRQPDADAIARRRRDYFLPYHAAIAEEIARLRRAHPRLVLYDAHSIRSRIPRLFDGALPHFNIGSNRGASCAAGLTAAIARICADSGRDWVLDGRFVGGWTTRFYGAPATGLHAVQMELAMRLYLDEPADCHAATWPPPFDPGRAAAAAAILSQILQACISFAATP